MSLEVQRQRPQRVWTSPNRHLKRSTRTSVICSMSTADVSNQPNEIDVGYYNANGAQSARSCSERSLLQGYRDEPLVLERLVSVNDQQKPPISLTAAAHKNNDDKELSADRPPFNKTPEESSPGIHYSSPETNSPSIPSFVAAALEGPKLQQSSIPRRSGAFPLACNSIFTLAAYTNNRFDRTEAWDDPKETRTVTHRSFLPLQRPSPGKSHSERPSTTRRMKRTIEEHKATMASGTANLSLQQEIRDGFDAKETVLPSKQHSAKRRRRSPPPLGMGSLSVTVGSKPITPRKAKKRLGIRQDFLVDPDLDPNNNTAKRQLKNVSTEVNVSTSSKFDEEPNHHIIPSIETVTMYNNTESRVVLPPLRTHNSIRQVGDQRHDSGSLDTSSSFLGSDTHTTAGFPCGSYSRLDTADSNAFETSSLNASRFWTSSISRASSETSQLSETRENGSTNDDETQCRSGADTSFGTVAIRESAADQLAWRRSKSHSCQILLNHKNDREICSYDEVQTALSPTTESWQSVQGRFTTWAGALEDLRPRPRPTEGLFQG
ncbi:hypothetical protein LX36DRAFT_484707 [Colletotrichum falcatum]|nr:hypothetical protein LX36DRAFT_484707 [Colletotrichum falcatum]